MRPADEVKKESLIEALRQEKGEEWAKLLELIGEKCRQKYSKARDVFRFVDQDHSMRLSQSEVRYFFRFFNIGQVQADKFFKGFDVDEDGEINYVEFLKYLWPHVNPGNEATPWRLTKEVKDEEQGYRDKDLEVIDVSKPLVSPEKMAKSTIELPGDLRIARINIAQRLNLRYKNNRDAFRDLDINRDGRVSPEEMRMFLRNLGWEHVADKFFVVLSRGEEKRDVSYKEFTMLFDVSKDIDALRLRL
jgi:Ca2+-binding EF-hand superfamily protein